MAEPLKHFFGPAVIAGIAADLRRAGLDPGSFEAEALHGLEPLELLDRGRHIARVLRRVLPSDPVEALEHLVASFGPPLGEVSLNGMAPFRYLPHVFLIPELGLGAPEAGLAACHAVTRRFTAEWCIRPFVEAHPGPTWAALHRWVEDPDVHVRRLVSEGLRPRLPWAPRLRALQRDPSPSLPLLERLRDDPELYVRRSVANHLNDIAKDHPERAVDLAERWLVDASEDRRWVVRHALRHLVKAGHPRAIAALGFAGAEVEVAEFVVPAVAAIGGVLPYRFTVRAVGPTRQRLVVDLVVHYQKARGTTAPKVFKVGVAELGSGEAAAFRGRVSLREMSTRRHHPGTHLLEVQVNGVRFPGGQFTLHPAAGGP